MASLLDGARSRLQGLQSGATGLAGSAFEQAKKAYAGGQAIGESLGGLVTERVDVSVLREAGYGVVDAGMGAVEAGIAGGYAMVEAGKDLAERRYEKRKMQASLALLSMAAPVRARVLLGVREAIKAQAVADPDMWTCVDRRLREGIDLFWDDLTLFIENMENDTKDSIRHKVMEIHELAVLGDAPCIFSPRWFRAKILYHYLPFNTSIFGQFKDLGFWMLTILSLCTIYGVRVGFFSLLLLLIVTACPGDEYQMVQYILALKGTQFLSSGVGVSAVAAVQYYLCIHPGGKHTCDTDGPGVKVPVITSAVDFFGCCILVWAAFLLLPCSQRAAGLREIGSAEQEAARADEQTCCGGPWDPQRGGRLRGLLGYDLLCFLISCALLAGLAFLETHERHGDGGLYGGIRTWEIKEAIFWARVFYALLSFPFTIFLIPGLNSVLTHTSPTGYNLQGLCVPYVLPPVEPHDE